MCDEHNHQMQSRLLRMEIAFTRFTDLMCQTWMKIALLLQSEMKIIRDEEEKEED